MEVSAEKSQYTGQGVPLFTDANNGNVIESPIKDIIKAKNIVDYTHRPNYWQRFADRIGASAATKLSTMLHLDDMLPQ